MRDQYFNRKADGQLYEVISIADGGYMVLVNGHQWGGTYDRSGAGDATFPTMADAREAFEAERGTAPSTREAGADEARMSWRPRQ